ncbi:MAG TPA: sugar transferase [Gemmatimonadaceae bacterium]|nr:sugar transferase [Gemmatimonadaceae bacterium]
MSRSSSGGTELAVVPATPDVPDVVEVPARAVPPLLRRRVVHTNLQQRRPAAVRRHAARTTLRVGIVLLGDILGLALAMAAIASASALLPEVQPLQALAAAGLAHAPAILASLFLALAATGGYRRRSRAQSSLSLLKGCLLAAALLSWQALLVDGARVLIPALALAISAAAVLHLGRRLSTRFIGTVWPGMHGAAPAVLVGSEREYQEALSESFSASRSDYRLVGWVSPTLHRAGGALGTIDTLAELIHESRIETVVIGGYLPDRKLMTVLDVSLTAGCELLYPASSVRLAGFRPRLVWRQDQLYFELGAPVLRARELLVKRIVDVIGAAAGLVLLAPVLLIIAALVWLDSRGPIFFTQHRAGLGGRRFRMLKFRTMRLGADDEKECLAHLNHSGDSRLFKIPNDPRVTRLGIWLRRWSLDELPQLWNVLRGDMSLVGPRPFFERDLARYEDHHFRRLGAKPGITGLWQVSGRSEVVDFEEVVRLDREYIERWSLWLDLKILGRTLPAVLSRTGAY